jgi:hypothetical protein
LSRNCFLKHVIEGKMEEKIAVTRILGRRLKQLPDALRKVKDEALERKVWRTCFRRGYKPVVRQSME